VAAIARAVAGSGLSVRDFCVLKKFRRPSFYSGGGPGSTRINRQQRSGAGASESKAPNRRGLRRYMGRIAFVRAGTVFARRRDARVVLELGISSRAGGFDENTLRQLLACSRGAAMLSLPGREHIVCTRMPICGPKRSTAWRSSSANTWGTIRLSGICFVF